MAIQLRRGSYDYFDPTKLMPGEFAVVTEDDPYGVGGQAIYMCFGSGIVKRIVGADDLGGLLDIPIHSGAGTDSVKICGATSANGNYSLAEGYGTAASGSASHAEGYQTEASGAHSHSEGYYGTASGDNGSHAEGYNSMASGTGSHAEGYQTEASGDFAHSENSDTTASGDHSHAEGFNTVAAGIAQHVSGRYNVQDNNNTYSEIIGNGTGSNARSNARTLDWSGNEVLAGKLTVGAAPTANMDVTTKQYVDSAVSGASITCTDANSDGNIVISFGT